MINVKVHKDFASPRHSSLSTQLPVREQSVELFNRRVGMGLRLIVSCGKADNSIRGIINFVFVKIQKNARMPW